MREAKHRRMTDENLAGKVRKIVLELFDIPVNSWTEGENTM